MALGLAHYHERWDTWQRCRETTCTDRAWDRWLCTKRIKVRNEDRYTVCGQVYFYLRVTQGKVGGPPSRQIDRRYGYGHHYRCKHEAVALLRHESAPDPEQPLQDALLFEQIERLKLVAKEARKKRGRKTKARPA